MFKQLRTRFIILTMTSVLAVLLIIMTAINLLNYRNVLRDSDRILSVLADNQGKFPAFSDGQMHPEKPEKKELINNDASGGDSAADDGGKGKEEKACSGR